MTNYNKQRLQLFMDLIYSQIPKEKTYLPFGYTMDIIKRAISLAKAITNDITIECYYDFIDSVFLSYLEADVTNGTTYNSTIFKYYYDLATIFMFERIEKAESE